MGRQLQINHGQTTTCITMLENNRKSTLTLKLFANSGQNSTPIHFYCT